MSGGETFCEYERLDFDIVAMETLADVDSVLHAARVQEGRNECIDDNESPPCADPMSASSHALEAVDLLCRYYGGHRNGLNIADAVERDMLRLRKMHHRSITNFFTPYT